MAKDNPNPLHQFSPNLVDTSKAHVIPYLLTPELVRRAYNIVKPNILAAMASGITNRHDLCTVIRNSLGEIVLEDAIGENWEYPYQPYAREKSHAAWREGVPTRHIQNCEPFRTRIGDTMFVGGVPIPGKLGAVGCSGVQNWFDEMFGNWIAATIYALCIEEMQEKELRTKIDERSDFHGGPAYPPTADS